MIYYDTLQHQRVEPQQPLLTEAPLRMIVHVSVYTCKYCTVCTGAYQ
jgi:hypothetical protein